MYSVKVEWYGDFLKNELTKLEQNKFTGNVTFRVDFKEGGIAGINCGMSKSVRMPQNLNSPLLSKPNGTED